MEELLCLIFAVILTVFSIITTVPENSTDYSGTFNTFQYLIFQHSPN